MPVVMERATAPINAKTTCDGGGKAYRLRQLRAAGFRVPDFVVSPTDVVAAVDRLGLPLAVRSSASVEDGADVSFAGQFHSFLNLNSLEEVKEAIRRCRECVSAPSVRNYCHRNGVDVGQIRMDVILQQMIQPELAGVAFTVNPATGQERTVIDACAGLADNLLAGHATSLPAGHPLLGKHREQIESVARQIHRHFGAPQDIEFAIAGGQLYILQTRPITRISFSRDIGEWTNADFRDGGVSSTVCSPLMWSLYELAWEHSLKGCLRELRLFQNDFVAGRLFFGRPYWNLGAVKSCLAKLPGFVERDFDDDLSVQMGYQGPGRCTPLNVRSVLRAAPALLSIGRFFRKQRADAERLLKSRFAALEAIGEQPAEPMPPEATFRQLIEGDYLTIESTYFRTIFAASLAKLDLLSSFPDADYAALSAGLPPLRHMAPVRMVQALPERTDERLAEIVSTYRHHYRLGLDLIHPRWDEDRTFVQRMLAELPGSGGEDPQPAFQAAYAAASSRLPRSKRRRFRRKLERLRHFIWLREELRDLSNRMYYHLRRHVLYISRERGLGDDLFFATFREILADDRSNIAAGREVYESYRNFAAPNEIGGRYHLTPPVAAGALCGIAASPGCVSGTAHIARSVAEAATMQTGQILVCQFTDPGWTPVLDRAAGVVTETGGLLSHAAILCREYGIPAVLGVTSATRRIRHGSRVTIDGGTGQIDHSRSPTS